MFCSHDSKIEKKEDITDSLLGSDPNHKHDFINNISI